MGIGSLARPGRDLTGGGAFGIPGYAGIGASGLGWGEQEDFDESIDPPATIENVRTRALSCHPSRPFFLVGSSNTHVYLWEVYSMNMYINKYVHAYYFLYIVCLYELDNFNKVFHVHHTLNLIVVGCK